MGEEPTSDQKVEALERILRAIFGRPEGEIKYLHFNDEYLVPIVGVECDVDDAVRVKGSLEMQEIDVSFFDDAVMRPAWKWEKEQGAPDQVPEAKISVELLLSEESWKTVGRLEKEIEELKKKLGEKP